MTCPTLPTCSPFQFYIHTLTAILASLLLDFRSHFPLRIGYSKGVYIHLTLTISVTGMFRVDLLRGDGLGWWGMKTSLEPHPSCLPQRVQRTFSIHPMEEAQPSRVLMMQRTLRRHGKPSRSLVRNCWMRVSLHRVWFRGGGELRGGLTALPTKSSDPWWMLSCALTSLTPQAPKFRIWKLFSKESFEPGTAKYPALTWVLKLMERSPV